MTNTPNEDESRPEPNGGMKGTAEFLGVITAIIGILTWLGLSNWQDVEKWLDGLDQPSSSATASALPLQGAQVGAGVEKPTVRRSPVTPPTTESVDRGCGEALATLKAFGAVPVAETAGGLANQLRAYADTLDRAADRSGDRQVVSAISVLAVNWRLMATHLDNGDIASAQAVLKDTTTDIAAVRDAC